MASADLHSELAEINAKLRSGIDSYSTPQGMSVSYDLESLRVRKQEILTEINASSTTVSRRNYGVPRRASS